MSAQQPLCHIWTELAKIHGLVLAGNPLPHAESDETAVHLASIKMKEVRFWRITILLGCDAVVRYTQAILGKSAIFDVVVVDLWKVNEGLKSSGTEAKDSLILAGIRLGSR